jgi:hypothetical protein
VILLIPAFLVTRITGKSHWHPDSFLMMLFAFVVDFLEFLTYSGYQLFIIGVLRKLYTYTYTQKHRHIHGDGISIHIEKYEY